MLAFRILKTKGSRSRKKRRTSENIRVFAIALFVLSAVAIPAVASQFISMPFDGVVRGSAVIVRQQSVPSRAVGLRRRSRFQRSASLKVAEYLRGHGPDTLLVREAGGTVGDTPSRPSDSPTS